MYPIKCYGQFLKLVFTTHPVNLTSDTVKVALLSSSYTPDQDAHTTFNDVATYEISGEGYTTGGIELTNKQVQYDPDNNKVVFTQTQQVGQTRPSQPGMPLFMWIKEPKPPTSH